MLQLFGPSATGPAAPGSRALLDGSTYGVIPGGPGRYLDVRAIEPAEVIQRIQLHAQAVTAGASAYTRVLLRGNS